MGSFTTAISVQIDKKDKELATNILNCLGLNMSTYINMAIKQLITSRFKKAFKKALKQGKDENKFLEVLNVIANGNILNEKYKNHKLTDDNEFKDCYECHITPDWLLVYKYQNDNLVLILFATGSHSELFKK